MLQRYPLSVFASVTCNPYYFQFPRKYVLFSCISYSFLPAMLNTIPVLKEPTILVEFSVPFYSEYAYIFSSNSWHYLLLWPQFCFYFWMFNLSHRQFCPCELSFCSPLIQNTALTLSKPLSGKFFHFALVEQVLDLNERSHTKPYTYTYTNTHTHTHTPHTHKSTLLQ